MKQRTQLDSALTAAGFSRRTGSPLLNNLLGVQRLDVGLGLSGIYDVAAGPTELGVLIDLAMGVPARAQHGLDHRLVTSSMDLALSDPAPSTARLRIDAEPRATRPSARSSNIFVVGRVHKGDGGPSIGTCGAAFAARNGGLPDLPWETGERPRPDDRLDEASLTELERSAIDVVTGSKRPPGTTLLDAALDMSGDHCALHPSAVMMNRAGAVQGGVVFGFAVTSALHDAGEDYAAIGYAAHLDFVGPLTLDGGRVNSVVNVLRAGRRQRLVRVDLTQSGDLVATATVRHTRAGM